MGDYLSVNSLGGDGLSNALTKLKFSANYNLPCTSKVALSLIIWDEAGRNLKQNGAQSDRGGCTSGGVYVPCIYTHARRYRYRRQLGSLLLYLVYAFRALINSLVC